jgi:hypothetical protein
MKTLLALLLGVFAAIGAVATGLFILRKKQGSWDSAATSTKNTATSWRQSAADQARHATDKAAAKDATDKAATAAKRATDKVATAGKDAADATTTVADQMKEKVAKER